tara:strand:+ start:502 stop:870 length:369 start_codon:yes stop_codon:yes gene_type:complete
MSGSGSRAPAADTDSAKWGLEIQSGQAPYPVNQRVLARNLDGNQVITKVHIRIADTFVLLFPDGQLATQPVANTLSTPNPFIAIDKQTFMPKSRRGRTVCQSLDAITMFFFDSALNVPKRGR